VSTGVSPPVYGSRLTVLGSRLTHQMPSVEILIKGRDLISAEEYSQSNHGRWCTIGWPTTPNRWRQLGAAGAAGAHRSSTLQGYGAPFLLFSLPTEPVECEELTKGVFYRRGAPEQDVRRQGSSLNLWRWWGNAPRVGS
jgi:hypothetical protein